LLGDVNNQQLALPRLKFETCEPEHRLKLINLENTDDVSNRLLYNEMDLWHPIKVGAVKNPQIEQQKRMKVDEKYDVACSEFKQRLFY